MLAVPVHAHNALFIISFIRPINHCPLFTFTPSQPLKAKTTAASSYLAYFFVYSFAVLLKPALSSLKLFAAVVSTASSGTGSKSRFCVAVSTDRILEDGFQASGLRIPMHMLPCSSKVTLGCQMRVLKEILGGLNG